MGCRLEISGALSVQYTIHHPVSFSNNFATCTALLASGTGELSAVLGSHSKQRHQHHHLSSNFANLHSLAGFREKRTVSSPWIPRQAAPSTSAPFIHPASWCQSAQPCWFWSEENCQQFLDPTASGTIGIITLSACPHVTSPVQCRKLSQQHRTSLSGISHYNRLGPTAAATRPAGCICTAHLQSTGYAW